MKSVFYASTLVECNMTVSEAILYSQILYRSICRNYDSFNGDDGKFSFEKYNTEDGCYLPIDWVVSNSIADDVNIPRSQFYKAKKSLEDKSYISEKWVKVVGIEGGYFELLVNTTLPDKSRLSGMSLIIYSYLADKTKKYGKVDTYHSKIASKFGIHRVTVERILAELRKLDNVSVEHSGWKSVYVVSDTRTPAKEKPIKPPKPKEEKQEDGVEYIDAKSASVGFDLDADDRTRGWRDGNIDSSKMTTREVMLVMQAIRNAMQTKRPGTT